MTTGRKFHDVLMTLGRAPSPEVGFARALKQMVALSGATVGGLSLLPVGGAPVVVTTGARRGSSLDAWIRARLGEPPRGVVHRSLNEAPPRWRAGSSVLLRAVLGEPSEPLGQFV